MIMITKKAYEENIAYFNKLYDEGMCHKELKHMISGFEFTNEWGTKDYPHPYSPLPCGWKDKLKIFKNI